MTLYKHWVSKQINSIVLINCNELWTPLQSLNPHSVLCICNLITRCSHQSWWWSHCHLGNDSRTGNLGNRDKMERFLILDTFDDCFGKKKKKKSVVTYFKTVCRVSYLYVMLTRAWPWRCHPCLSDCRWSTCYPTHHMPQGCQMERMHTSLPTMTWGGWHWPVDVNMKSDRQHGALPFSCHISASPPTAGLVFVHRSQYT